MRAVVVVLGVLCAGSVARADSTFVITIDQDGSNVVGTGSGSINLTDLTFEGTYNEIGGAISGFQGAVGLGAPLSLLSNYGDGYEATLTGSPADFGPGGAAIADSGSGDLVEIYPEIDPDIFVPIGYVSGDSLSDTSTWDNTTIAGLGLTDGSYTYDYGNGADAGTIVIDIGPQASPVPEPASLWLLVSGGMGLLLLRLRKRPERALGQG